MTKIKYGQFESQKPELAFSFLYPDEWSLREIVESTHAEVFIARPRPERAYTAALIVRVTPGAPRNLDEAVSAHLSRRRRFPGYRELARAQGSLAGNEAVEVEIGYHTPERLDTIHVTEIPVRERRVFWKRAGLLVELIYTAPESEYDQWLEAFKTLARTFVPREESPTQQFYPLVTRAPTHALREEKAKYQTEEGHEQSQ